jgi:hypothetical protein
LAVLCDELVLDTGANSLGFFSISSPMKKVLGVNLLVVLADKVLLLALHSLLAELALRGASLLLLSEADEVDGDTADLGVPIRRCRRPLGPGPVS